MGSYLNPGSDLFEMALQSQIFVDKSGLIEKTNRCVRTLQRYLCVFRVIWVYTIFAYFHTITSLYLLYIFSWTITGAVEILYFRHGYKTLQISQK